MLYAAPSGVNSAPTPHLATLVQATSAIPHLSLLPAEAEEAVVHEPAALKSRGATREHESPIAFPAA